MTDFYSTHPTRWSDDDSDLYWISIRDHPEESTEITFQGTIVTDTTNDTTCVSVTPQEDNATAVNAWYERMYEWVYAILRTNSAKWFKQTLTPKFIQGKIERTLDTDTGRFVLQEIGTDLQDSPEGYGECTVQLDGFQLNSKGFYPRFRLLTFSSSQESEVEESAPQEEELTIEMKPTEVEENVAPAPKAMDGIQDVDLSTLELAEDIQGEEGTIVLDEEERKRAQEKDRIRALYQAALLQKMQADQAVEAYLEGHDESDAESTFTDYQQTFDEDFSEDSDNEEARTTHGYSAELA